MGFEPGEHHVVIVDVCLLVEFAKMRVVVFRTRFPADVFAYSSEKISVIKSESPVISGVEEALPFGGVDYQRKVVEI